MVKKGEHPGYCTSNLDFVLIPSAPELTPSLCISKGGLRFKSKLCMGFPRHLICNKSPIPFKWKCGHVEGERAFPPSLRPCRSQASGAVLLPYPRDRLHSPGQMNGMCGISSTRHAGAPHGGKLATVCSALEEPGNKGEKYRLKNQN